MKILFLHLSDFHIKTSNAYNEFQIQKIADSLRTAGTFHKLILVLSGDIAFSGEKEQYRVANGILKKLQIDLQKGRIYTGQIEIVCVPGNHDISFENPPRTSAELNQIYRKNTYNSLLEQEISKQNCFMDFATLYKCDYKNSVVCQRILDFNGFRIEVNMIDTAVFSLLCEEDKGLHFIDQYSLNILTIPTGADFVITVMHHSYDWYIDSQKEQLEQQLLYKSSLIFLGHEHRNADKLNSRNQQTAVIHAGGLVCNDDDWTQSSYEYGVLDTDTLEYIVYPHKWDSNERQYNNSNPITHTLPRKPSQEKKLHISEDYKKHILTDTIHNLSPQFTDYYVFPRIGTESFSKTDCQEFLDIDSFIEDILVQKRVVITGAMGCGKTTLLKALFLKLSEERCVVYCDIDTIKNKASRKIVRSNFVDIYGEDDESWVRYCQLPSEKKVLIIDDIDQINTRDLTKYIASVSDEFGLMIFSTKKVIDIDMYERMKTTLNTETSFTKYIISPFYADKRKELIRKIIAVKQRKESSLDIDELTDKLCESVRLSRNLLSLTPDFIIDFVDYYCNNVGSITNGDSSVFSKVFESSITSILSPYIRSNLTIDKIYRLLSMVAYYVHFNKKYPVSEEEILNIILEYNGKYDDDIRPVSILEIFNDSKILYSDGGGYRFTNKNHLAYFVAREVNFLYNKTQEEKDLTYLLQNACFGINADVLMFISYITDNPRILSFLLATTSAITNSWSELDFRQNLPRFLELKVVPDLSMPANNSESEAVQKEINAERESEKQLTTVDLYDYNENDIEKTMNQVIRALSLLMIISKCLPGFEHNMDSDMKQSFVQTIYSLPNKIYNAWAQETEREYDRIIKELVEEGAIDYIDNNKPEDMNSLLNEFQVVAMALLLDIYNISVTYATRGNTFRSLDKFAFSEKDTYRIQHLMMLEKQNKAEEFVSSAIEMYTSSDSLSYQFLVKLVVKHAMVFMKALDYQKRDRIKTYFFPKKQTQQTLLVQRTQKGDLQE